MLTMGGGSSSLQQGGTTPIYQDGSTQGHWHDASYNVGSSSSTGAQSCVRCQRGP